MEDDEAPPVVAAGSFRDVAGADSGCWLEEASATSLSKPLLTRACQWCRPCDEPSGLRDSASALMVNFSMRGKGAAASRGAKQNAVGGRDKG